MIWFRSNSAQCNLMRRCFASLGDDRDAVCLAYMEAERDGKVARLRGAEDVTPGTHIKALWQDGKLKGWLKP